MHNTARRRVSFFDSTAEWSQFMTLSDDERETLLKARQKDLLRNVIAMTLVVGALLLIGIGNLAVANPSMDREEYTDYVFTGALMIAIAGAMAVVIMVFIIVSFRAPLEPPGANDWP